ncbi:MAG TPA: type I polyketide synthase [Symbiobacteriaceae bacterium]|nr:type I polyketide synthase [Symbiobacteriaceae bacterium]
MEPIAIIGLGCRWPGASGPDAYWDLLCTGTDAVSEVPPDRWDGRAFYDPDDKRPGKSTNRWGGFLKDVAGFDCHFFGISPREAVKMDPQQRLLLEVAWEALEDAGQVPEQLAGKPVGVFIGAMNNDYSHLHLGDYERLDAYSGPGVSMGITASRLAYTFDLRGMTMTIDTACSSSLVAIHLACQSLRNGECGPVALAGGVNLILWPAGTIFFSKAGVISKDGPTRTFDAGGSGFSRAEGAGVVVLKPLAQAEADGDTIYAVIRGSAINQDGRTNGLMAPNRWSQERVLREAYRQAGVSPGQVQYVEAHGTGTLLGDPIEANALGAVMATDRPPGNRCLVGSVKPNIGHAESAAGMAGIIKVALMLKHRMVPPNAHFDAPNPYIDFSRLPIEVPRQLMPWPQTEGSALAGVSAFGFGGTNGHIVLEEYVAPIDVPARPPAPDDRWCVLPLSARSVAARQALSERFHDYLAGEHSLPSVAYTASQRRTHHDYRMAVVARSTAEARELLGAHLRGEPTAGVVSHAHKAARRLKVAFICSGQGPQWWGMARDLLDTEPVFRQTVETCDAQFQGIAGWSLMTELRATESTSRLQETAYAQPALFALQIGLAALWRSWGVEPSCIIGHSVGEVAAAYLSGALSLKNALHLIYHRAHVMQQATGLGKMVSLEAPADQVQQLLASHDFVNLSIAAINSPTATVVAGSETDLVQLTQAAEVAGITCTWLPVNYAFHHACLEPFQAELRMRLDGITARQPALPVFSTLTGSLATADDFSADYWCQQMRNPVRFAQAVEAAGAAGHTVFLELSPHPVLCGAIRRCAQEATALPSLRRHEANAQTLRQTAARLYTLGAPLNWSVMMPGDGRPVRLPHYPWQRERYWQETSVNLFPTQPTPPVHAAAATALHHPLLQRSLTTADSPNKSYWEIEVGLGQLSYLDAHRIHERPILMGMAMVELSATAARAVFGEAPLSLTNFQIVRPVQLPPAGSVRVQLVLERTGENEARFQIFARAAGEDLSPWTLHAHGYVQPITDAAPLSVVSLDAVQRECSQTLPPADLYQNLWDRGYHFEQDLRLVDACWQGADQALSRVQTPLEAETLSGRADYHLHPAVLDAACHAFIGLVLTKAPGTFVPIRFERVTIHGPVTTPLWSHVRLRPNMPQDGAWLGDAMLYDEEGRLVAELVGGAMRPMAVPGKTQPDTDPADWLYTVQWQREGRPNEASAPDSGHGNLPVNPAPFLILADQNGVGQALAAQLAERGGQPLLVYAGDTFATAPDGSVTVRPDSAADLERLFTALQDRTGQPIQTVVHLWSLDAPRLTEQTAADHAVAWERAHTLGPVSALLAAQRMADATPAARLWLVSQGAQAATAGDSPEATQAAVWGLGRTMGIEQPERWGGLVDLDPAALPAEAAATLLAELTADPLAARPAPEVAFRGEERLVPRLQRHRLTATAQRAPVTADGAYLITGGRGDLGLLTARWLVEQGARHLVLMGRSPLPPRAVWTTIDPNTQTGQQIEAISAMERLGATVHSSVVDASDPQAMQVWLQQYKAQGGLPIRGLIHAAGVLTQQALHDMAPDALRNVLRPKAQGTWTLHQVLADEPLDFFVLYSSMRSFLNTPGYSAYAAANAALDAIAAWRHSHGLPALSINWGAWSEVGMAARQSAPRPGTTSNPNSSAMAPKAMGSIGPDQGLHLLQQLMGSATTAQVAVLPATWDLWRVVYPQSVQWPLLKELIPADPSAPTPAAAAAAAVESVASALMLVAQAPAAERAGLVERLLMEQTARVLGTAVTRLDRQTSLMSFGMDSLMVVELKNQIQAHFGAVIPVATFFQGLNISDLATEVLRQIESSLQPTEASDLEQLLNEIEAMSAEEAEELLKDVT